jgi:hypothetical protein
MIGFTAGLWNDGRQIRSYFPPLTEFSPMKRVSTGLMACLAAWMVTLAPGTVVSQQNQSIEEAFKPKPRPKKEALPPSKLPLEVVAGERIALVGNSLAERFNPVSYTHLTLPTN